MPRCCGNLRALRGAQPLPANLLLKNRDMESFNSSVGPNSDTGVRVKVMRWPARLRIGHAPALAGKAIQISPTGVSLIVPQSVRDGERCHVRVDAFIGGNPVRLEANGSVVCCACVGMEGFRISMRFGNLDEDALTAIDALLHAR